jgi:hypothetical protein
MKGFSHLEVSGGVKEIYSSLSLAFLLTLALYIVNFFSEYRIGRHRSLVLDVSLGCAESNQLRLFFPLQKRDPLPFL